MNNDRLVSGAKLLPRLGRRGPRSKDGCATCRIRKVKCPEDRPVCSRCSQAKLKCDWEIPIRPRSKAVPPRPGQSATTTSAQDLSEPQIEASPTQQDIAGDYEYDFEDEASTETFISDASTWQSLEQALVSSSQAYETSLRPALATDHIPLSNSLILSRDGMRSFQYIPESILVLHFGKPWDWSMLSYVHTKIAAREQGVMRAFIAIAAIELEARGLVLDETLESSSASKAVSHQWRTSAATHYHRALQDLSLILERVSDANYQNDDLDTLFALWFLILHFGLYNPDLVITSHVHLEGIRTFLQRFLQDRNVAGLRDLPPTSQQLLLFISYLEVNFALGKVGGGQLFENMLLQPDNSPISHNRIWQEARVCLPKIWGSEYPATQILDDMENYRGLRLLQECQKLKMGMRMLSADTGGRSIGYEIEQKIWARIQELGEDFHDVLALARLTPSSGGRRVIWTIYHAALDYHALKVLFACVKSQEDQPKEALLLNDTLADILAIGYKAINEDPRQAYRFSWSLSMALLQVKDPIHRDWLNAQVQRARGLFSTVGVPLRILDGPRSPKTFFIEDTWKVPASTSLLLPYLRNIDSP